MPLRRRHYDHIWWCGPGCRLAFLFAFTTWTVPMVVDDDTDGYWPLWEALEYSPTNQTSLWESDWGYVEFTPIATYRSTYWVIIGGHREQRSRWCRDFSRVVSRNDGVTEHYRGTACRYNLRARWRIVRSYRVS